MAAFTAMGTGVDWQEASSINEITLAYVERKAALGQWLDWAASTSYSLDDLRMESGKVYVCIEAHTSGTFSTDLAAGKWELHYDVTDDDLQGRVFGTGVGDSNITWPGWWTMQAWCDSACTSFVDDGETIAGEAAVTMFTQAAWRTAAGLNSSGWRRLTVYDEAKTWDNQVFSYGLMQTGDIIGPWIFADLQNGLGALKWTKASLAASSGNTNSWAKILESGDPDSDCDTALDNLDGGGNAWDSGAWNQTPSYYQEAYWQAYVAGTTQFIAARSKSEPQYNSIPVIDSVGFDWVMYGLPDQVGGATFQDIDGDGYVDGQLKQIDNGTKAAMTTTVTAAEIGNVSECPTITDGAACPYASTTSYGFGITTMEWIIKWSFSNA